MRRRSTTGLVVLAVAAAAVVILIANVRNGNQVSGEVEAESLSEQFVSNPCETRQLYDDTVWVVKGTVIVPEQIGSRPDDWTESGWFAFSGGVHTADGLMSDCTSNVPQPVTAGEHREDIYLKWETPVPISPDVGDIIQVECRMHIGTVGTFFAPGLSGTACKLKGE